MKLSHAIMPIAFLLYLQGCAPRNQPTAPSHTGPRPPPQTGAEDEKNYAIVRVYYATDRRLTANDQPAEKYGADRGTMTYGTCDVSIPRDHRMGQLESPSIARLEFHPDPEKHVVLLAVSNLEAPTYFATLRAKIAQSPGKSAFIFIHGYNVTFEDAARRTGQMSYDLGFDGVPAFYSWPSQGTLTKYKDDEKNVEWTQSHLQKFLGDFVNRTAATNVYLIAHSMGTRALTKAFTALAAQQPEIRTKVRALILAAPDIDAEVFRTEIAPQFVSRPPLITLYSSSADLALAASKQFHGAARLGDSGAGLVVIQGMDTIDASAVDTSLLGHSYYAENRSILSDMFYLIRQAAPLSQQSRFGLRPTGTPPNRFWEFKP
jgi:esterase/lipase superfamily enzyme